MLNSPVEEIKNRLDIVDVVREYVNLEKAGANFRAPCPFHSEKTPSFFVNPSRQIWRCFGSCNEGGDMFKFIMRIEGVEFGDALRILAKKAGVELKKKDPELETKQKRLFDTCELTTSFFEKQLQESKQGKKAKEYLLQRGIKEESIKKWRLGYAPVAQNSLSQFLIGEGYTREELKQAGVSVGKGDYIYDRFRARIMFPIFNLSGSPVGFGGRTLFKKDKRAKYINSPATPLYDKSRVLYGMYQAKMGIRREGFAVVVEGYTDVILCHQAGYDMTISSSGTALTPFQLDILRRYTETVYTAFDMDEAGGSATKKGIDLLRQKDFDVKVIIMPEGSDPADMVLKDPQEWERYLEKADSVMNFYFQSVLSRYDMNDPREKSKAAKELLLEIKKIKNSIERSHYVSQLARALMVSEESVMQELRYVQLSGEKKEQTKQEEKRKTRKELLEEKAGSLCAKKKDILHSLNKEDIYFFGKEIKELLLSLKQGENPANEDLFNYLSLLPEMESDSEPEKELLMCLKEIKRESVKEELKRAEAELREAEGTGDKQKEKEIIGKISEYSKKLQNL